MANITNRPDEELEVDANDSSYGNDDTASERTSLASNLIRGHIENGRRYNSLRSDYWGPADETQFESMDSGHHVQLIMLSDRDNMLFCAPMKDPRSILDIGTGPGTWAIDTADKFPNATVIGVDLYPPQNTWVPPNRLLEVEDVTQDWTWKEKFDLIHLSYMLGSFTDEGWDRVYKQAYDNLEDGGWIEQIEPDCRIMCDDGSMPEDSFMAGWGETFFQCAEKMGHSIKKVDEMSASMKRAGFVNIQERYFKLPIGPWTKDPKMKEAGKISREFWLSGLEGFAMFLLTNYGSPTPWSAAEVLVYTAGVRGEMRDPKIHAYHYIRRVWGQKPSAAIRAKAELVRRAPTIPGT